MRERPGSRGEMVRHTLSEPPSLQATGGIGERPTTNQYAEAMKARSAEHLIDAQPPPPVCAGRTRQCSHCLKLHATVNCRLFQAYVTF